MTEATIAALRDQYLDWTGSALAQMSGLIAPLAEQTDGGDPELQAIFEIAHNIKGMGGSFGFPVMSAVGQLVCLYLRHCQHTPQQAQKQLLQDLLNMMEQIIQDGRHWRESDPDGSQRADIVRRLKQVGVDTD